MRVVNILTEFIMDPTPLINTVSADVMGRWLAIRRLWGEVA